MLFTLSVNNDRLMTDAIFILTANSDKYFFVHYKTIASAVLFIYLFSAGKLHPRLHIHDNDEVTNRKHFPLHFLKVSRIHDNDFKAILVYIYLRNWPKNDVLRMPGQ